MPMPELRHRIKGELTIYTVGRHKPALLAAIAQATGATELDVSQVTEIDTAGLQLLLVARSAAAARGQTLRLEAPSAAVRELLELCRLHDIFGAGPQADPARREPTRAGRRGDA